MFHLKQPSLNITIAYWESLSLYVKIPIAPSERFSAVPEAEKSKPIETDSPIMWQCQPSAPHRQTEKDEIKCRPRAELDIQSEDSMRRLAAQSELCHSQEYSCEVDDDLLTLKVDVKGDLNNQHHEENILLLCNVYYTILSLLFLSNFLGVGICNI